jgi:hypothetical protein
MPKTKPEKVSQHEPVAWAVRKRNPPVGEAPVLCWCELEMRSVEKSLPGCTVIPLYRQPTLTDAEREAICQAVTAYDGNDDDEQCAEIAATLRGLLERTK